MALTVTFPLLDQKEESWGNVRAKIVEVVAAAADYAAGGYQPVGGWAKALGMRLLFGFKVVGGNPAWGPYIVHYDSVNDKLMVLYPSGGGAASPAAVGDPAITAGAVAVTSNAANGSADLTPGRGKELAAATDISGFGVLRLLALGN